MSGGGVSDRPGRKDDEELDDFSNEPGLRSDPEGLRVLSSYGARAECELSEADLLSPYGRFVYALRLDGRDDGFDALKLGVGLLRPLGTV